MSYTVPLQSEVYYDKIDTRFNNKGDDTKCDELKSLLDNQFQNSNFSSFCSRLTAVLNEYNSLKPLDSLERYRCKYFNLWICDRISNILNNFKDPKFSGIKEKIQEIWRKSDINGKCGCHFISYIEDSNYSEIKNLYDYALNYKNLQHYFDKGKITCSAKDKKYIKESLILYRNVKDLCKTKSEQNKLLCEALKDTESIYNNDQLSKLTCNGELLVDETSREFQQMSQSQTADTQVQDGTVKSPIVDVSLTEMSSFPAPTSDGITQVSSSYKAMTISFPLVSILFIFFILYRFTPYGSWLSNHILKKRKIPLSVNEEIIGELSENVYDPINENVNDSVHHVGYHPA
ncbi:PIR Superfamily Protein [Plasmodium ovale wallikeri]|uniref:PIR Superfamily Protein n=1 Tax=Plasmodium ovale wallikeri TaxID=864142 RepID=A0A1A9A705_PLAOA|nr:PIR Superfamily Protein [Plasmodium ovale wallikeri]SBT55518.1 PIR Superfamily Protein [Plasmodium ovale wallikeri]